MTTIDQQDTLCDGGPPTPPRIIATALKPLLQYEAKYTEHHPKHRDHCDNCVCRLQETKTTAPAPGRTAWKRDCGSVTLHLCGPCKIVFAHADGTDQRDADKRRKAKQTRRR